MRSYYLVISIFPILCACQNKATTPAPLEIYLLSDVGSAEKDSIERSLLKKYKRTLFFKNGSEHSYHFVLTDSTSGNRILYKKGPFNNCMKRKLCYYRYMNNIDSASFIDSVYIHDIYFSNQYSYHIVEEKNSLMYIVLYNKLMNGSNL